MAIVPEYVRQSICDAGRELVAARLVINTQGNISVRDVETGLVAVTPHDVEYATMTQHDIVVLDLDGTQVEGWREPSEESAVHLSVYRARPDVNAVVHSEPVNTNVFGVVGKQIDAVLVSLLVFNKGPVPAMPFRPSGSSDFGEEMLRVMGEGNAVIWGNHGLLTCAATLQDAIRGSVAVESAAEVLLKARALGEARALGYDELGAGPV
jgi:ribulose-5-phosphate 4-epimerase/fuculose-1-phosphate aldolase